VAVGRNTRVRITTVVINEKRRTTSSTTSTRTSLEITKVPVNGVIVVVIPRLAAIDIETSGKITKQRILDTKIGKIITTIIGKRIHNIIANNIVDTFGTAIGGTTFLSISVLSGKA